MMDLRSQLIHVADEFVSSLLDSMRTARLGDLAQDFASAKTTGRATSANGRVRRFASGTRRRSSAEEIQRQKDVALAAAKALKGGFSKADVMKKSGSNVDLGRPLSLLVREGKLIKKGDRRTTRYSIR
jgi:hypothetical protein